MAISRRRVLRAHAPSARPPRFLASCIVTLLLTTLALAGPCATQTSARPHGAKAGKPYALIFGTVWGPDDRAVYGVKVRIRRSDRNKPHWELISDHRGEFAQRVPPGPADYLVWADLNGFKSPEYKTLHAGPPVTLHIENEERQDTGLHLTR